jgi:uncharacterized protein YjbJ (UPF0337 family)/uncharacterized membrane protein
MAQRVAAIFGSREAAQRAADALTYLGADREQISMLARGEDGTVSSTTAAGMHDGEEMIAPAREVGDSGAALTTTDAEDVAQGAATGAVLGAIAGVAAGLAVLMVPGFGLVAGAGPLLLGLGGASAAAGAVAGGVYGGLRDIGIEEPYARAYEERIRSGDVLLTAIIPTTAEDDVLDALAEYGAEDVSFAEDTTMTGTAATTMPADSMITERTERIMTVPSTVGSVDTPAMTAPPAVDRMDVPSTSVPSAAGMQETGRAATPAATADVLSPRTTMTSPTDVDVPAPGTTMTSPPVTDVEEQRPIGSNPNIARGEAKQVEGELRDRAGDTTTNPMDDLAAKGKKLEGKAQEEFGDAEEAIRDRRA